MTVLDTKREPTYASEENLSICSQNVPVIYYVNGYAVPLKDFEVETRSSVESEILPYLESCIDRLFFHENGHLKEKLFILEGRLSERLWVKAIHGDYNGEFKRELRVGVGSFPAEKPKSVQYYDFG